MESGVGFLLYRGVTEGKRRKGGDVGRLYSEHRGVVDVAVVGRRLELSMIFLALLFHGPCGAHVKLAIGVSPIHSSTIDIRVYENPVMGCTGFSFAE